MSGHPSSPPEHPGVPAAAAPEPGRPAPYRGRFAPSPTGELHPGSLLAAFGSWLLARHHRGTWLVRIEDLDPPREVPGAADRQLRTLAAFGLESDEPVRRQSARGALYRAALAELLERGLAFECRCSRSELAAAGGIHRRCVGAARAAEQAAPQPAVRLRVADDATVDYDDAVLGPQRQDVAAEVGDFVLRRADGYWAYQLAVVVDDAEQGITDVVRGADLLDSTARQILLQRALRLPTPTYAHLPLLLDAQGRKLSKSDAARPLDPADPLPALRAAWLTLGQDPAPLAEVATVTELLDQARLSFSPAQIPKCAKTLAAVHNTPAPNAV